MLKPVETGCFLRGDSDFSREYSSTRRIPGADASKKSTLARSGFGSPCNALRPNLGNGKKCARNVIAAGETVVGIGGSRGFSGGGLMTVRSCFDTLSRGGNVGDVQGVVRCFAGIMQPANTWPVLLTTRTSLFQFFQIILSKDFIRKVAQLHL